MTELRTPLLAGSSGKDSPNLAGWGIAVPLGALGGDMQVHERLRKTSDCETIHSIDVPDEARRAFYLAMGNWIDGDLHGLWYGPEDNSDGHKPDDLAVTIGERFYQLACFYNGAQTQSPIEDMLAGALLWLSVDWGGMPVADHVNGPDDWRASNMLIGEGIQFILTPQARIAGHKVDFLLWFCSGRHIAGVAIECDGHAFHEKTKEQAARDKKRDREILTAGFPVLRFAGSEIYRDVIGCVQQVRDALDGPLDRVSKDSGLY